MLHKQTFINLVDGFLRPYSDNLDKFEEGLGVNIEDGWLVSTFDKVINALTDSFFETQWLDIYLSDSRTQEKREFMKDWGAINEAIYHYCFNADFGRNSKQLEGLVIISRGDNVVEKIDVTSAGELYDAIVKWINREEGYDYLMDTSTRRGRSG